MIDKLEKLSPGLRSKIFPERRKYQPSPDTPVTNMMVRTKRHLNGGKTVDAGLHLKKHCDDGGKLFITMSGAGSSFEMGVVLSDLIRAGKVAAVAVTGANLEESMYRYVAHSHYAYIPDYLELTRAEEKELDDNELRRITDTFLPEDVSVRKILPKMEILWREAQETGQYKLWHEYFYELFRRNMVEPDPMANPDECWLYQAYLHNIFLVVPGVEDSTMGNIFAQACYDGDHEFLSQYKLEKPFSPEIVHHSFRYMHRLAEWYMDNTKEKGLAFVQLGGGIAGDFPICVVPHLKKDFLYNLPLEQQEKLIRAWACFIEIFSSPMSYGSYSGAGYKEKISWGKFETDAWGMLIQGDYTEHFPDIVAIILGW